MSEHVHNNCGPICDLEGAQLDAAVDELQAGNNVIVTGRGNLFVMLVPCPKNEVDFHAASRGAPLSKSEQQKALKWCKRNIPRICRHWIERHPTAKA
jgi:antitoxin (DNA-binding transcriptional repressor) of toxin-antitoxin stability system